MAALQRLAEHCVCGEMLEEMLHDRLVCGINNGAIQRRLLAESDLTLAKAIAVAQAAKVADTEVKEIQSSIAGVSLVSTTDNKDVHKCTSEYPAKTKNNANRGTDCYRCGAKHNPDQCHFKSMNCHACGKLGHIAKVCQTKKKFQSSDSDGTSKPTHQVVELSSNTTEYNLLPIGCQEGRPLQTTVKLGHPFVMEVDTGAAVSLINENVYQSSPVLRRLPLHSSLIQLCTYTGEGITVKGELSAAIQSKSQVLTLPLLVVPGQGPAYLDVTGYTSSSWIGLTFLVYKQAVYRIS